MKIEIPANFSSSCDNNSDENTSLAQKSKEEIRKMN